MYLATQPSIEERTTWLLGIWALICTLKWWLQSHGPKQTVYSMDGILFLKILCLVLFRMSNEESPRWAWSSQRNGTGCSLGLTALCEIIVFSLLHEITGSCFHRMTGDMVQDTVTKGTVSTCLWSLSFLKICFRFDYILTCFSQRQEAHGRCQL